MRIAAKAASIAVSRKGTSISIPVREEVFGYFSRDGEDDLKRR